MVTSTAYLLHLNVVKHFDAHRWHKHVLEEIHVYFWFCCFLRWLLVLSLLLLGVSSESKLSLETTATRIDFVRDSSEDRVLCSSCNKCDDFICKMFNQCRFMVVQRFDSFEVQRVIGVQVRRSTNLLSAHS